MASSNKIVQVPIDKELLEALDELSQERGSSRSALIRSACREYLRRVREEALDAVYERGYQRLPEDDTVARAQASVTPEVLPEESW
ncbi:MAG: ribbon-helix-helix protein, CopG family [Chloroflexi bacterium]|nr:ribbon-helix-helix protein, CopG family [Chloroflexota bacterium]